MLNKPAWVADDARVRTRTRTTEPTVRVRSRKAPDPEIAERRWPNGSAVFTRSDKPRKAFRPDEEQPGFLGRVVREGNSYRVFQWSSAGYTDLGLSGSLSEALLSFRSSRA